MSIDLKAVPDHPATLLNQFGGTRDAVAILRAHEEEKEVTFAALDNDALIAVREAYEALMTSDVLMGAPVQALTSAVNDLLGMADD